MNIISIFFIAIGLAMDAFVVSLTIGMNSNKKDKLKFALKAGLYFGGFQALMPLAGWIAGIGFKEYIEKFDHWVAFILLAAIGGKMLIEAFKSDDEGEEEIKEYSNKRFVILAIATSIDALAVGVSFAFLSVYIPTAIAIIGIVTLIICIIGVFIGDILGKVFQSKAEIIGGFILIVIGIKILIEHIIG